MDRIVDLLTISSMFLLSFPLAFLGASTASLLCLVLERLGEGAGPWEPYSHCACGRELSFWEVIPVLGYILVRGKARCCGADLPNRWLYLELGAAAGFFIAGLLPAFLAGCVVCFSLVGVVGIETRHILDAKK